MTGIIDTRLAELGIDLPNASAPVANYVPYVITGNLIYIAGQIPIWNDNVEFVGKVGTDISIEDGIAAARLCTLNILSQTKVALVGDLDRIVRIVKVSGFINAEADFKDHSKVVNGASNLFVEIFGKIGRHSRFAVGVNSLPLGASAEIDAIIEFD